MANDTLPTDPQNGMEQDDKHQCLQSFTSGKWNTLLVWIFRLILGGTFAFSGFVKAIDPWGTVIKMQEYLQAMGLASWSAVALPLTFLLFTLEFLLGIFILTGSYRRLAAWGAALFMAAMLPLTLWIYIKDPVPDCGCFGDALVISNAATFWKNVTLAAMSVWLILYNRHSRCLITPALQWIGFSGTVIFIVFIGWIGYIYQPLIDFRPYPVGSSLYTSSDTDPEPKIYGIYERDGHRITIPIDSIPDDSWTFVDRKETAAGKAEKPDASHAALFDEEGEDVTDDVLGRGGDMMIICYSSLPGISATTFYRTNSLQQYCKSRGIDLIAIASATPEQIGEFRDLSLSEFPIYLADESWIKEVVRGNPAVVYLHDGKIIWKSSLAAMAPDDFMSAAAPKTPDGFKRNDNYILGSAAWIYLIFIALLMALSLIPRLARLIRHRKNRFIKDAGTVAVVLLSLANASCSSDKDNPEPPSDNKSDSAILIYMVGNNSLSSNIWDDLNEVYRGCERVQLDHNRVILFLAQPNEVPGYNMGLVGFYEVKRKPNGAFYLDRIRVFTKQDASLDPDFISQVMNEFRRMAPAETYGLFMWSHASGWLPGNNTASDPAKAFGDDNGKSIDIELLAGALPDGMFRYIWFDCCFMGAIEDLYALRYKASFIVASPTEIMAEGAPYQLILPELARKEPDLREAARKEFEYYSSPGIKSEGFTISITDCSRLDDVAREARNILADGYPYISVAGLQSYGSFRVLLPDLMTRVTFYDFGQTFREYASVRDIDPSGFNKALENAVMYKAATPKFRNITIKPENYSGLSVHVPLAPSSLGYNAALADFYRTLSWTMAVCPQY